MEKIKIIHIGDVHYPERHNQHLVDIKDKGVNKTFIENIAPNKFDKVAKSILSVIESQDIQTILMSGDLTSYGDTDGYQKCVDYFIELFSIKNCGKDIDIHVVPGNHDLDRSQSKSEEQYKKFEKFISIWKNSGKDILKPAEVRSTEVEVNGARIKFLSLNTCVGCGEYRAYPESIREQIKSLVSSADLKRKIDFEIYGERLDTPAADAKHISVIEDAIVDSRNKNYLAIILSHHGLLPQSTVRVDLYTEMVNSGYIRSLFDSAGYPVIYCHGHIHDDPVEVLFQPNYVGSNLVSISAPEFCDGFNLIEIGFSSKNMPVGCTVTPYRMTSFSAVREKESIRISLQKGRLVEEFCNTRISSLYQKIPSKNQFFEDLHSSLLVEGLALSKDELALDLLELEWAGVISLQNRKEDKKRWIIARVGL